MQTNISLFNEDVSRPAQFHFLTIFGGVVVPQAKAHASHRVERRPRPESETDNSKRSESQAKGSSRRETPE
jgi:hypothetical protein